jgi:hypothetical protein
MLTRWQWDEVNIHTGIMIDWDDLQAVATRAVEAGEQPASVEALLGRFKERGATHLALSELSLDRLLEKGEVSVTQGSDSGRVYLQAKNSSLADRLVTELQARLPQIQVEMARGSNPIISFSGHLPTVAEVGLGFDPAQAELAYQVGLAPVARPIGYSWVRPLMIERTLNQAAALGARIVAVQGSLIPGHEFEIQTTVTAMRRNGLTYAYFRESRHQKGDWFLAKNLAPDGLVILAHEFEPPEMLEEDWFTISYRWAGLAAEAGVRLCSVRFFRILHAADPLESVAYVGELAQALTRTGFLVNHAGAVDLSVYQPPRDRRMLAFAGLSTAGAAGLASDLLPVPDSARLAGIGLAALSLTGLPFLEKINIGQAHRHDHDHHHNHHHHPDHHEHDHHQHHHHHHHDHTQVTAYAPKGLSLAAAITYPAAGAALSRIVAPSMALVHTLLVSTAGAAALNATTTERDYLLGIEEYRGYNLDWLLPLTLAAGTGLLKSWYSRIKFQHSGPRILAWLPLAGIGLAAVQTVLGGITGDHPARLDREHRHAHTHHLSAFQRLIGDLKMMASLRPLRKWSFLAPLGAVGAVLLQRKDRHDLAAVALTATVAGQVATLTGFRNGQRPLLKTVEGRSRSWAVGALLAGLIWLITWLIGRKK